MIKILHNSGCSKSQCALDLLRAGEVAFEVVDYINNPLSEAGIRELVALLGLRPDQLVRRNEPLFEERFAGKDFSGEEWIRILATYPILIQRPILISGDKAVVGRPPEAVSGFIKAIID